MENNTLFSKQPIIPISFKDVEIEKTIPGEMIHIFPQKDSHDLIEEIVQGLYLSNYAKNFSAEADELMKQNELEPWLIMALTETKRLLNKAMQDSTKNAMEFMAHYEI